jgi:hypothetical protein
MFVYVKVFIPSYVLQQKFDLERPNISSPAWKSLCSRTRASGYVAKIYDH